MLKRTATAITAALVLALGGTAAALASNGADDSPGHHQEHKHGHKGKGHHHNGKGDDHGGETEAAQEEAPPMSEYGY